MIEGNEEYKGSKQNAGSQPHFLFTHLLSSEPQPKQASATTKTPSQLRLLICSLASRPFSLHCHKGMASSAHKSLKCSGVTCFAHRLPG